MNVKIDAAGRRTMTLELELPGTPEQVWAAIATAKGIASWFIPTGVDERAGGAMVFHLAPGVDSTGIITAWEPPRRLAYEEPAWKAWIEERFPARRAEGPPAPTA